MTTAVYRTQSTQAIPPSQSTAPVFEHNCLFTHDVRRKSKRWQDGFLRYHTFNKRVMVYDVPRNYIGDTHWTGDSALQDGDELQLDKNGVLVQVAEAIGKTETDVSGIRQTKKKQTTLTSSPLREIRNVQAASSASVHPKHRSLKAMLGQPQGSIGRARLPTESPFAERERSLQNSALTKGRPEKRARYEGVTPAAPSRVETVDLLRSSPPPSLQASRYSGGPEMIPSVPETRGLKALKLASKPPKRRMLFCQEQAAKRLLSTDHVEARTPETAQVAARLRKIESKKSSAARALQRGPERETAPTLSDSARTSDHTPIQVGQPAASLFSDQDLADLDDGLDDSILDGIDHNDDIQPRLANIAHKTTEGWHAGVTKSPLPHLHPPHQSIEQVVPSAETSAIRKPLAEVLRPPPTRTQAKPTKPTVNFHTAAQGTSAVILGKPFSAPKKAASPQKSPPSLTTERGPWSREAFDLFTWRPPSWDEAKWCVNEVTKA